MQSTQLSSEMRRLLSDTLQAYPKLVSVLSAIGAHGGHAYLVGGAVRDLFLNVPVKDIDIEIHGLAMTVLERILTTFGPTSAVGKSFGVLRLHGLDIDWSLPRSDSAGRKPSVAVDPEMGIEKALKRRDLTMNAMAIDLQTYQLIDPFGGVQDMQNKVLRTPDVSFFVQDPLRFYRVMQFVARFAMYPDAQLQEVCARMDVHDLSHERVSGEIEKLLLKSARPALGFRWVHVLGRLNELFPELGALVGCQQAPNYHPEGDVFEHTMQVLDAAAAIKTYRSEHEKLLILYAALCHDMGKPAVTTIVDGKLKSPGHAQAGVAATKSLLKRLTHSKEFTPGVCALVEQHMQVAALVQQNAGPSAYKRLANKLDPHATLRQLALLAQADQQGRRAVGLGEPPAHEVDFVYAFLERAQRAFVLETCEQPILHGQDVADLVPSGPRMGTLLKIAYEIQLSEGVRDPEVLKRRAYAQLCAGNEGKN